MSGTSSWRLFVALPVPTDVKAALEQVQQELRRKLPSVQASWTKPDNMHLTLRFLGDVGEGTVNDLQDRLRVAVTGIGRLGLSCQRLGCFSDLRCPRVIWAGVQDAHEQLAGLAGRINEGLRDHAGTPPEALFVGHITMARIRPLRRGEAEQIAGFVESSADCCFGTWTADKIELIRSERSREGSRYTTIAAFNLAGDNTDS